jgi:hypothetical protein
MPTVATLNKPVYVDAGSTKSIVLPYSSTDTDEKFYCTFVQALNFTAWSDATGSSDGSDMSEYFEVGYEHAIDNIVISIKNSSTSEGYLTECVVQGELLEMFDEIKTYDSTGSGIDATFSLDSQWLSVTDQYDGSIYKDTETTVNDRNRIDNIGETLIDYLSTPQPYPVIQLRGRHNAQLMLDLEDKITLTLGTYGIDQNFRIHKISHRTVGGCQDILTTLWLYPVLEPAL